MLASNLNRLFSSYETTPFSISCRFFLSYLAIIRSNYCNPQIIYVANSFLFFCCKPSMCISLVVLTHVLQIFIVLTFFFCSSAFFMRISRVCHLIMRLRRYFDPPISPEHPKQFQKILLIASYLFFSKNGATDVCWW